MPADVQHLSGARARADRGGPEAFARAREGAEDDSGAATEALKQAEVRSGDLVVGIAAGGTTPFVAGALEEARRLGARTGLVTVRAGFSALYACRLEGDGARPEIITGSTRLKAGTVTKLVLNTLTTSAMIGLGKVYGNLMVDLQVTAAKLETAGGGYCGTSCTLDMMTRESCCAVRRGASRRRS